MAFWKEQPSQPVKPRLRSNWSGGNFQVIDKVTGTVIFEIDATNDNIKLQLAADQVETLQILDGSVTTSKLPDGAVTTVKVNDEAVTPRKTSENWMEAGTTITGDQKYSLLGYASEVVALADPNGEIIGVAYNDAEVSSGDTLPVQEGLVKIIADASISGGTDLKAGWYGRAQTWRESNTTLGENIPGADNLFTGGNQPGGNPIQVAQATDQAADRGKPVTIVGTEPTTGDPISEIIYLDDTDTTTAVAGSVDFDNVTGAFFGSADAAANIEVQRASDNAVICTILATENDVGAPFMETQTYAYCSKVQVTADAQSDDWVTIYGLAPDSTTQMERLQLDNATPGKITSTNDYRLVTRIMTGELTNTNDHTVVAVADEAGDKVGKAIEAATTDGDVIKAYIKPNLV